MELGKPLVWLHGVAPGVYEPAFPVWLVREEPERHQFVVALDETMRDQWSADLARRSPFDPVRRYAETMVRTRLHQRVFRGQVLIAYGRQCALCRPACSTVSFRQSCVGLSSGVNRRRQMGPGLFL